MEPDPLSEAAERYADPEEVEALRASVIQRLEWRKRRGFKTCSGCHLDLTTSAFRRNASRRDGLHHACRLCEACKRPR